MPGPKSKILVVGLVGEIGFHQSRCCACDLYETNPDAFEEPEIRGIFEFEWKTYIQDKIKELRGEMWAFKDVCIVFCNNVVIGGPADFWTWAEEKYGFSEFRPLPLYETIAKDAYQDELLRRNRLTLISYLEMAINPQTSAFGDLIALLGYRDYEHKYVFLTISIGEEDVVGQIVIELYSDIVPKTCENFSALCTGEEGTSRHNDVEEFKLHYTGSIIHRIVKNGWIQGGDIWYGRGNGGESVFGPTFEDENYAISHDARGVVSMANKGRHSNGSQFFITLTAATWMDTQYVAFGKVIEGSEVLERIEEEATVNERPLKEIMITDSGDIPVVKP